MRILSLTLCLALLCVMTTAVTARTIDDAGSRQYVKNVSQEQIMKSTANSARQDTFFLFADTGAGSKGSIGTDSRGFTFDNGPDSTLAGWTKADAKAQSGNWWHVHEVDINIGQGTEDITTVPPFDVMDTENTYALWCGRFDVCGWEDPTGYGGNWDQFAIVDIGPAPTDPGDPAANITWDFWYIGDFEGTEYDYFQMVTEDVNGDLVDGSDGDPNPALINNTVPTELTLLNYVGAGTGYDRLIFRFISDSGWSDEDGSYLSNIGAVWLDNVVVTSDQGPGATNDFELGDSDGFEFAGAPGPGLFADLYSNLFAEDICRLNPTWAWAFFDLNSTNPEYPIPVVASDIGMDNHIESPILNRRHLLDDPVGEYFVLGTDEIVDFQYWVYRDLPLTALVFYTWGIAAETDGLGCLGGWTNDNYVFFGPDKDWLESTHDGDGNDLTSWLLASANGFPVIGAKLRFGCLDLCEQWEDQYGDCLGHTPSPYFDNIRLFILGGSSIAWNFNEIRTFQDNFPDEGTGFVRFDNADELCDDDCTQILPGDSMVVSLNADIAGGIMTDATSHPDMVTRPMMYMYFQVIEGPHAGMYDANMGQPDPMNADLSWSPYVGTDDFVVDGVTETWNKVLADSARLNGNQQNDRWAFDLNDEYFQAGDIIRYFFWMKANNGTEEVRPQFALANAEAGSAENLLRGMYIMRCLPTGNNMLLVNDDYRVNVGGSWREALRYNGYTDYDYYFVYAPSSGVENGLAGRANASDIDGYTYILWDSGAIPSQTLTNAATDATDKSDDTTLLSNWLNTRASDSYLWVCGDKIANDLTNAEGFLQQEMGATLLDPAVYDEGTFVYVPYVTEILDCMQEEGIVPSFWVDGGCPSIEHFSAVGVNGDLAEVANEFAVTVGDEVAGIWQKDPDGDGFDTQGGVYTNRVLYMPYSYAWLRDVTDLNPDGYSYVRRLVGLVLSECFQRDPDTQPDSAPEIPAFTSLDGNFPNPFNPKTTIRFSLSSKEHVNLAIYDISGRLVTNLVDGPVDAGVHEIVWSGKDAGGTKVASGVYFYKMNAGDFSSTEKMIMLK